MQKVCKMQSAITLVDVDDKFALEMKESSESAITIETAFESVNNVKAKDSKRCLAWKNEKKIFRAPPGVIPYHVKWSTVRRKSGDQRLIFVWPQNMRMRSSCLGWLVPFVRRMLVGLVYLGAIHLWPGEFLPTTLPPTKPLAKTPVKCSIIEPLWEDDEKSFISPS